MPAWATVTITLGASLIAVAGTLAARMFELRHARRVEEAARRDRAAVVIGRIRTLLADLEPLRIVFNINPETPGMLKALGERWAPLRDELSVFAAGDVDPAVTDAAAKLEVAVSNTINRVGWHVRDLLVGGPQARDYYDDANYEHLRATALLLIVLNLVRGRDVAELKAEVSRLEESHERAKRGTPDPPS